ncbi:DUF6477 family protein [Pseudotabrizicola alkalilacus]|uniref:Uncharacterized protein n=1 Tax=Pseudotabrizicola alkalilacus TaxID=2305252 RepID=A0A411Z3M1_9RHOB|nr:DUF6477 family protein [Pseudotabrizicola alkalilacus]RGP37668.1 hypothetical protein D1012_07030 [Pseudotabrizicola alkalilacus]
MSDFRTLLADLRRPRLLMHAARFGVADYRRDRDLKRLISLPASPEATVRQLLTQEDKLEQNRQRGDAAYSITRHIEVLIALLAETPVVMRGA